jgi:hypothetical protein
MKKIIIGLGLMISSSLIFGQANQAPQSTPANATETPVQSGEMLRNYRNQLHLSTPSGDKFLNHQIRKHIRQLRREERHLRRELRRLRRERVMRMQGK